MIRTLLSLAVLCATSTVAVAQTNLLENGGFEEWSDGLPTHWAPKGTSTNVVVKESADGRSGKAAEIPNGKTNARLCYQLDVKAGNYKLTYYAKAAADGVTTVPGWQNVAKGSKGYNYGTPVALTTDNWSEVAYEFSVAEDGKIAIVLRNDKKSKGSVLVDDVAFVLSSTTPDVPNPPSPNPPTGTVVYQKALTDDADGWVLKHENLPEGITFVWKQYTKYGLKASAYADKKRYATEAWAISPAIELKKKSTLSFEHALNFYTETDGGCTLCVREGEEGAWVPLAIPTMPSGKDWNYVNSGSIDLSAYVGKTVQFGFKYVSTESYTPTWEIKNFTVAEVPTGVETLKVRNARHGIYNLSGRRVVKASPGLHIINGVKTVIR